MVTFQPGEMMQYVNFTGLSDNILEGTEMLTAVLFNPSTRAMIGQQDTAMINITEDTGKLSRNLIGRQITMKIGNLSYELALKYGP